ncbi:MAG: EamA family transporter [Chloroflexi bacterium]|nr:MAG: EamA family transporter [Chloroflexota bacterium]MBL1194535.1 EamA family transporter [Chloroflexota bacterium]NOH11823.1 EamA family transporter [Chloroflexota bacterium]
MATKTNNSQLNADRPITVAGLINLLIVYIVWGSTYLAIRIAVREGAGFPPFTMALMRVVVAGAILLMLAKLRGRSLRIGRKEFLVLFGSGILLWTGGNGLVTFAEQRSESGLAALIVASVSIWTAIIEALVDRKRPSWLLIASLVVGFVGIGVLTYPVLSSGIEADILSVFILIGATVSWAMGTVLLARNPLPEDFSVQVSSGYQMLSGAVGFIVLVLLTREPLPTPTAEAWLAWGYLVLFGAVLAYTAFVSALRQLPTSIVMTYPYVNPVVAVILGAIILQEEITIWTLAGSALILLGVAGVFRARARRAKD